MASRAEGEAGGGRDKAGSMTHNASKGEMGRCDVDISAHRSGAPPNSTLLRVLAAWLAGCLQCKVSSNIAEAGGAVQQTLPDIEPSMLNMVGRDWGVASAVPAAMSAARDSTCRGGGRAGRGS